MEPVLPTSRPFLVIIVYSTRQRNIKILESGQICISKNINIHNSVVEAITQYTDCKSDSSSNSFK